MRRDPSHQKASRKPGESLQPFNTRVDREAHEPRLRARPAPASGSPTPMGLPERSRCCNAQESDPRNTANWARAPASSCSSATRATRAPKSKRAKERNTEASDKPSTRKDKHVSGGGVEAGREFSQLRQNILGTFRTNACPVEKHTHTMSNTTGRLGVLLE